MPRGLVPPPRAFLRRRLLCHKIWGVRGPRGSKREYLKLVPRPFPNRALRGQIPMRNKSFAVTGLVLILGACSSSTPDDHSTGGSGGMGGTTAVAGSGGGVSAGKSGGTAAGTGGALPCLLYTSDAADERSSVDLGG